MQKRTALQKHDKSQRTASLSPRCWESAMKHESNKEFFCKEIGYFKWILRTRSIASSTKGHQGYDEINRNVDKIQGQFGQLVERAFRPSKFKTDVLTLDIAKVYQTLTYELKLRWRIGP
jgi:hypothetical protein